MQHSGKKLVLGLLAVAMIAGAVSWFYQFESSYEATTFWGSQVAPLIARPSQVEIRQFVPTVTDSEQLWQPDALGEPMDLSKVRGMVHLRRVLMLDSSFNWDKEIEASQIPWKWRLELADANNTALIVLADEFQAIGVLESDSQQVRVVDCQPMADSLREYFSAIGLLDKKEFASTTE